MANVSVPFEQLPTDLKLNALHHQLEQMMSDISREAQESRESNAEVKRVVEEVVQRLLDAKAADAATIAAQAAEIATLKGIEVDAAAAAADLDAQQAENAAFAEELKTVGVVVTPPPAP